MGYFKPNNRKYKNVVQKKCTTKSRKLQFRLSGDDLLLFEQHKKYNSIINESEFIKDKLLDSLYKDEIKRQKQELEGI